MAAAGEIVMDVERAKPTISHRFSSLRFMKTVKQFNPIQKGHVTRRGLENMMRMPDHLMIPVDFLQWLADHVVPNSGGVFVKKKKTIHFTKRIVDKVFGFSPDTVIPYALTSDDPDIVSEVKRLRAQYLKGKEKKIPIKNLESILLGTNDEVVFMRTFIFYFISTVLCPCTSNSANPKYLYALTDRNMHQVQKLDYGNLCIDVTFKEIDDWKERVFGSDGDYNKELWIGGCLPMIAVVYMDFCKLDGNPGGFDYRLPRMAHVKKSDFLYLIDVDMNRKSRRQYGVLPFRRLYLTPYGDPDMLPGDDPDEEDENEDEDVQNWEFVIEEYYPPLVPYVAADDDDVAPSEDDHDGGLPFDDEHDLYHSDVEIQEDEQPAVNEGLADNEEPVVNEHEEPAVNEGLAGNEEPAVNEHEEPAVNQDVIDIDMDEIPNPSPPGYTQESPVFYEGNRVDNVVIEISSSHGNNSSRNISVGGQYSTFMSFGNTPLSVPAGIAECFVTPTGTSSSTLRVKGHDKAASELLSEPKIGPDSLDKKNRKKRAAKSTSNDNWMPNLRISPDVDAFYTKFLRGKYFKGDNSPTFIIIGGLSVTYDSFYKSFKARGDLVDDTMCLHALMYNEQAKRDSQLKPHLEKFMFSPYVAAKLIEDPSLFDKSFVLAEFGRISQEVDIGKIDIMHFPSVVAKRWTLLCANPLYRTIHFFDPAGSISGNKQDELLHNLVCNLNTVCRELKIRCKDFEKFTKCSTLSYPTHALLHDCGFYVMLYGENFNGKVMVNFTKELIPNYRKLKSFTMFYSDLNEVEVEPFERMRKH